MFFSCCSQPVYFGIKAFISYIKPDQTMWYRACKTCNKKVTEALDSGYWCEGCQKKEDDCSLRLTIKHFIYFEPFIKTCLWIMNKLQLYRYILVVKVSDASGEAYLSVFNEHAEKIIGLTADELNELKSQVSNCANQFCGLVLKWMLILVC